MPLPSQALIRVPTSGLIPIDSKRFGVKEEKDQAEQNIEAQKEKEKMKSTVS